jgi:AraC-like DNA-binding protein
MRTEPRTLHLQRTLFDGELLQVGYIEVHPVSSTPGEVESAARHVLALPLAGVFAKHDGPRRQVIATPDHALFISAGQPYRLSFPGCIGDQCLALRFTSAALARLRPEAMAGETFDAAAFAPHALLPPAVMLARGRYWQRLACGKADPLEAEEGAIHLLDAALTAAQRMRGARTHRHGPPTNASPRSLRHVQRTIEAVATQPERRWTLGDLAREVSVSPGHLAHVFRAETGTTVYGYVVRARLARALHAVLDSDAGLTEVALDAGFASHSHFTARFRALFGHTPLQVRRGVGGATARQLRRIATAPELAAA